MTAISHSTIKSNDGIWVLFAVCLAALTSHLPNDPNHRYLECTEILISATSAD